eukprot:COSAG01_NODE_83053_length_102_cov_8.000000_1_plen_22_part_01
MEDYDCGDAVILLAHSVVIVYG